MSKFKQQKENIMKKIILALVVVGAITAASNANAGGHKHNPMQPNLNVSATAVSKAHQNQNQSAVSDAAGGNVSMDFEDKLQIPNAPGLSSGSSNTTAKWRKYKQRQISTILGGYTNIDMELATIEFLEFYLTKNVEERKWYNAAACIDSAEWRKLRKTMGLPCAD